MCLHSTQTYRRKAGSVSSLWVLWLMPGLHITHVIYALYIYLSQRTWIPADCNCKLGNQKLWWCSPYAPVPRQAWMCTSISPKSQEPLALCCLSALVQKELNNKSWSTPLLEFRDKGIFGACLVPIGLPQMNCFAVGMKGHWPIRASAEQLPGRLYIMGICWFCLFFHLSSLSSFFKGNLWFAKFISLEQTGINPAVNDGLFHMLFCVGQDCYSQ